MCYVSTLDCSSSSHVKIGEEVRKPNTDGEVFIHAWLDCTLDTELTSNFFISSINNLLYIFNLKF